MSEFEWSPHATRKRHVHETRFLPRLRRHARRVVAHRPLRPTAAARRPGAGARRRPAGSAATRHPDPGRHRVHRTVRGALRGRAGPQGDGVQPRATSTRTFRTRSSISVGDRTTGDLESARGARLGRGDRQPHDPAPLGHATPAWCSRGTPGSTSSSRPSRSTTHRSYTGPPTRTRRCPTVGPLRRPALAQTMTPELGQSTGRSRRSRRRRPRSGSRARPPSSAPGLIVGPGDPSDRFTLLAGADRPRRRGHGSRKRPRARPRSSTPAISAEWTVRMGEQADTGSTTPPVPVRRLSFAEMLYGSGRSRAAATTSDSRGCRPLPRGAEGQGMERHAGLGSRRAPRSACWARPRSTGR